MHDYIKERTIKIGKYIVETRKTVRVIAKEFGVSKSTVHKDLTERLPEINPELANEVKGILDYHKSVASMDVVFHPFHLVNNQDPFQLEQSV